MSSMANEVEAIREADPTFGPSVDRTAALWHPVRTVSAGAFVLIPAHIFVVTAALVLAAGAAAERLPDGLLVTEIGARSLQFVLGMFGVVAGLVAGLTGAAKRLVDGFEEMLQARVRSIAPDDARLFPSVPTADARAKYDGVLDRMVDEMLGRVRVPGMIRRLIRRGLEHSLIEDFLDDCERRGIATIGATEVRNWTIATGLPHALAPLRGQIRVLRVISLGPPILLTLLLLLISLIGSAVPPTLILRSVCALLGGGVLVAGYVGARTHRRPRRWFAGLATAGLTVTVAPWAYQFLLPSGIGAAWLAAIAFTLLLIAAGLRTAFVSADGAA